MLKKSKPSTSRQNYHRETRKLFPLELSASDQKLVQKNSGLKLPIELIPDPQSHKSLHHHLDQDKWDKIRFRVYRRTRKRCEICVGRGPRHPVECHEIWSYDIDNFVQKLERLQPLCPKCHRVKHIGIANPRKPFKDCLKRFKQINKLHMQTARNIVAATRRQWIIRSAHEWTLDVSHISKYGMDPAAFKIDNKKITQLRRESSQRSRELRLSNIKKLNTLRRELIVYNKSRNKKRINP